MSGKRFFLDTNAIIALLRGDAKLVSKLSDAEWVGISIISVLEYLSYPYLGESDRQLLVAFMKKVDVVDLEQSNNHLLESIVSVRKKCHIKLPDAIIVASTIIHKAALITADKELWKIPNLVSVKI